MALDTYAVGAKRSKKYTVKQLTSYLLNDRFCGLVKCDIVCPKNLYVPILPSKGDENRLLFNLIDKYQQVYASPELKYALEEGYIITKVYNTFSYEKKGRFIQRICRILL